MQAQTQSVRDEELAGQAQAGSLTAFEQLVYRHESGVYRFLCACCRNPTEARDLTQDTFVSAYAALAQFSPRRSFAAWIFTIARRKFIDLRRVRRPVPWQDLPELADPTDPARAMAEREAVENIWCQARRLLPGRQFQALWLKYQKDLSILEVAQAMGLTQVHVKVLLFRARRTLIRTLNLEQPDPNPTVPGPPPPPRLVRPNPGSLSPTLAALDPPTPQRR